MWETKRREPRSGKKLNEWARNRKRGVLEGLTGVQADRTEPVLEEKGQAPAQFTALLYHLHEAG